MSAALDGEIHVWGGVRVSTVLNDHYAWNPLTGQWRTVGITPFARTYQGAGVYNDAIYAFGGSQNDLNAINNLYKYTTAEGWKDLPKELSARFALGMATLEDAIYIYGGLPPGTSTAPIGELWMIK